MASSRARPLPTATDLLPARTPGVLGRNDGADPDAIAALGDTPGPLGLKNHGGGLAKTPVLARSRAPASPAPAKPAPVQEQPRSATKAADQGFASPKDRTRAEEHPKIGVALSFHPILFKKLEFPGSIDEFKPLSTPEFDSTELLADGESKAVIQVHLVELDESERVKGQQIAHAPAAKHFDEGSLVLELSSGAFGELAYDKQKGTRITIPVREISSGESLLDKSKGVVFTTSREIGVAKLAASITGNEKYEYVKSFTLPKAAKQKLELMLGSRKCGKGTSGHDALKLQWFLRKFGFLSYKEQKAKEQGPGCEWGDITEIALDGDFGERSAPCLRDFDRVARGGFRSQKQLNVAVTRTESGAEVTKSLIDELLEWRKNAYSVEPYNGLVQINHSDGTVINAEARIVYGALVVGDDPMGYVELAEPIGHTALHWGEQRIVAAESIRSAIKLFKRAELVFRLHDADTKAILDDANLNPTLKTKLIGTISTLRKEQKADASGKGARDVRLHSGHRTPSEQDALWDKGETVAGEPCKHKGEAEKRAVGTCTVHPLGKKVTNAKGSDMASWHQFGLAVDLIFSTANGGSVWGDDKDWDRNGTVGKSNGLSWGGDWTDTQDTPHLQLPSKDSPGKTHKDTYKNTTGTELQKLQAVWNLL